MTNEAISLIINGRKITVPEAIQEWIVWLRSLGRSENTIYMAEVYMKAFCKHADIPHTFSPAVITHEQISAWVNACSPAKAATRSVMLAMVRSFFRFCSGKGWSIGDPSQLVEVNNGRLTFAQKEPRKRSLFTEGEIARLVAETRPRSFWRAAILLGRWTGLRLSDIACLEWASLEEPGHIRVWTQKRDRRVSLPLEPEELRVAVAEIHNLDDVYCFPEQRDLTMNVMMRSYLSTQFANLCRSCGIAGKSFHSFRHNRLTELVNNGMSLSDAALVAGHLSPETTRRYVHASL